MASAAEPKPGQPPARRPATPTGATSGFRWPEDRPGEHEPVAPAPRGWQGWFRIAFTVAGVLGAAATYLAPPAAGLPAAGQRAIAIFLLCTTLWITSVVPVGITGLLAVALLGLGGVMTPSSAFAAFGSSAVFFLIGVFILAAALIESGLSKRLALLLLVRFDGTPYRLATGMAIVACLMTVFMPAQATCAMLFPIAVEVSRAMRLTPGESPYGKVLFLSLAWGAHIGSNASFLGSARAPLALGMLATTYGQTITFFAWVRAAAPIVLVAMLLTPLVLRLSFPREAIDGRAARRVLEDAVARLGRMSWPQLRVAVIVFVTVTAWVASRGRVDLAIIAILSATTLFASGALRWEEIERHVHWNVVLMYGGAIALGGAIASSGAGGWLVHLIVRDAHISPYLAVIGIAVGTLVLAEFMSNAAAVAVVMPLAFSLGVQMGAPPAALVLATSIGAGLAFTLPISSAPNTIAFASGYLRMTDFLRSGVVMTLLSVGIMMLAAKLWWPLIGVL